MKPCPATGLNSDETLIHRSRVVVMHNKLHRTRADAQSAAWGELDLRICPESGLVYNAAFDPALVTYDASYDSTIPSAASASYCHTLAAFLQEHFLLKDGILVEAGCGKGEFLSLLCSMIPGSKGIGMDPSCPAESKEENLHLIPDIFRPELVQGRPSLVICRHVMDQMDEPMAFLNSVASLAKTNPGCGLFVELRDLEAMAESGSFWDFCYENHVYFTEASLAHLFGMAGFEVNAAARGLGGQYLWLGGKQGSSVSSISATEVEALRTRVRDYGRRETATIQGVRDTLSDLRAKGRTIAVWGIATKGVNFITNVDPDAVLIDLGVDINSRRHGAFVAGSGHEIIAPEQLPARAGSSPVIIIMNPAYVSEIASACHDLGLDPLFMDAGMNVLTAA